MAKCKDCDGTGKVDKKWTDPRAKGKAKTMNIRETCQPCDGTGEKKKK